MKTNTIGQVEIHRGRYEDVELGGKIVRLDLGEWAAPTPEAKSVILDAYENGEEFIKSWLSDNAPKPVRDLIMKYIDLRCDISSEESGPFTVLGVKHYISRANKINSLLSQLSHLKN